MKSLAITNSLLRVDRVVGKPPPPFERPNKLMDFWVMQLPEHADVDVWCSQIVQLLTEQAELLRQRRDAGSALTLFIQSDHKIPVLRLDTAFLKTLVELGISLEHYRGDA